MNVAVGNRNLAKAYENRAKRARAANDLDRELANLNLALPHLREAARIYRAINYVDSADRLAQAVVQVEKALRQFTAARAAAAAVAGAATRG